MNNQSRFVRRAFGDAITAYTDESWLRPDGFPKAVEANFHLRSTTRNLAVPGRRYSDEEEKSLRRTEDSASPA